MLIEIPSQDLKLHSHDLHDYVWLQKIAAEIGHPNIIDYWKSAPYLLNFMDNYEFKNRLLNKFRNGNNNQKSRLFVKNQSGLLTKKEITQYRKIDSRNAKMRNLLSQTIDIGAWKLLWVPPSLCYYTPLEPFNDFNLQSFTKKLIFSHWKVVPKTISIIASYEAERQMILSYEKYAKNTQKDRSRHSQLLQFSKKKGYFSGMPVLSLIYPCISLCQFDPLAYRRKSIAENKPIDVNQMIDDIKKKISILLKKHIKKSKHTKKIDERWYWAAPLLLDKTLYNKETLKWFNQDRLAAEWSEDAGPIYGWTEHVMEVKNFVNSNIRLGSQPKDLIDILAKMAIAGPGIACLRALSRIGGGRKGWRNSQVRVFAGRMAYIFRKLFNQIEATAMIRGLDKSKEPYWKKVLQYCFAGNIQSMLDEYTHILSDSPGISNRKKKSEVLNQIINEFEEAISIQAASLNISILRTRKNRVFIDKDSLSMRSRFAMRFDQEKQEDTDEVTRKDLVRKAFNSPFAPFIVATTSIGQEGLDFHKYCHSVIHWNLPSNPVDLEQREGRVHRYKGHAIRRNIAVSHGHVAFNGSGNDPWKKMFNAAKNDCDDDESGLIPYWITKHTETAKIERHVPVFRLSKDKEHYDLLRKSLVVYRMAFGQNRQEDLIEYLLKHFSQEYIEKISKELQIDLSPKIK